MRVRRVQIHKERWHSGSERGPVEMTFPLDSAEYSELAVLRLDEGEGIRYGAKARGVAPSMWFFFTETDPWVTAALEELIDSKRKLQVLSGLFRQANQEIGVVEAVG